MIVDISKRINNTDFVVTFHYLFPVLCWKIIFTINIQVDERKWDKCSIFGFSLWPHPALLYSRSNEPF